MRTAVLTVVLALAAAGAGTWWYTTIYDTDEARCERGDLDACTVLARSLAAAATGAADAYARDHADAIGAATSARVERARDGQCYVTLTDHDTTIEVSGSDASMLCEAFVGTELTEPSTNRVDIFRQAAAAPTEDAHEACVVPFGGDRTAMTLTIIDTGAAAWGQALCDQMLVELDF